MKQKIKIPWNSDGFWMILIVIITTLVFLPAVQNQTPIVDDLFYLLQSRRPLSSWDALFSPVLGLRTPLVTLSFRIDFLLFGEKFFFTGAHLENILFHAANAVMLYLLLRILRWKCSGGLYLRLAPVWSGLTALIFACHPQRVESVAWIAERKDVLAMFFGLTALYLFYRGLKKNRVSIAAPLLLLISFSAKPMWFFFFVPAAALIWIEERRFDLKQNIKQLLLPLIVTGVYVALHLPLFASAFYKAGLTESRPWAQKIEIILHNYGLYFLKTLVPGSLYPLYPYYNPVLDQRWIALVPLFLLLAPLLAFKKELKQGVLFGWVPALASFAAILIPTVGFSQVGNTDFADRYSYLPALFILIPLSLQLKLIPRRSAFGAWLPTVALLYLAGMIWQTEKYLPVWKDTESYYEAALRSSHPNCNAVVVQSGISLMQGNIEESERVLKEKLTVSPFEMRENKIMIDLFLHVHRGTVLFMTGKPDEGIQYYNTYFMSPDWYYLKLCPSALLQKIFSVGAAYHLRKYNNIEAAENLYLRCAEIMAERDIHYFYFYQGMAKVVRSDYAGAIPCFEKALAAAPHEKRCLQNLEYCRKKVRENKR